MPWATNDKEAIRVALNYTATSEAYDEIQKRMDYINSFTPSAIPSVQSLLQTIASLTTSISSGAEDRGLKRVADLEWFPGAVSSSLSQQLSSEAQKLAHTLGLSVQTQGGKGEYSSGRLLRS